MKRVLWILVTPTLILLILGLIVQYLIFPKFADWFIQQAQQKVKEETQLNVSIKSSQLSLLRLSVYLNDIVVDGVIPAVETPLKVERVQVRLDALSLILGELRIAAVIVDSPEIILN